MIVVSPLKRIFKFNNLGEVIDLDDPNPNLKPEEVMNLYSGAYPELTNATIGGPNITGMGLTYEFSTVLGNKG